MPRGEGRGGRGRAGDLKRLKPGPGPAGRSAKEIEDGISSKATVTWDPFSVLPKEVYLEIFNNLDDPSDKERFMNAHRKWYDLFKESRTLFLFGEVLATLASNGNGIEKEGDFRRPKSFYVGLENMAKRDSNGLSDRDYLGFRGVCRSWDAAVQKYVQLHPYLFRLRSRYEDQHRLAVWQGVSLGRKLGYQMDIHEFSETEWFLRKTFEWRSVIELRSTLAKIGVTHTSSRNPFLTRKIWLKDSVGKSEEWRTQVDNLLETYGHHVWHLKFTFTQKITPQIVSQFVKWMSKMPELKTLQLDGNWSTLTAKEMKDIDKLSLALPEMKKLSVVTSEFLVPAAFNKILGGVKGPLQKVLIAANKRQRNSLQQHQLPANVSEVTVLIETGKAEDFNHLRSYRAFRYLRKLTITLINTAPAYLPNPEWPEWGQIWNILEETFPDLEELNLDLPYYREKKYLERMKAQEQSLSCRLNLPKLKKLKIYLKHLASLDFIQPLKELEELEVTMGYVDWGTEKAGNLAKKETIKINMDMEKMWESNIWQVFPKLRKLHIRAIAHGSSPKTGGGMNLYGYVKNGLDRKFIRFLGKDPNPNWEMFDLFCKSLGHI